MTVGSHSLPWLHGRKWDSMAVNYHDYVQCPIMSMVMHIIEMFMGMGNAGFPSLSWYSHGNGNQIV